MADAGTLRFFCPIHEAGFEAPEARKVLCEITGHALAADFPQGEAWEYCCNCSTYSPSKLGKGESARSFCYSCQSEIVTRFACAECSTVSFDSAVRTRGQKYSIGRNGVSPECPACHAAVPASNVISHECEDIHATLLTVREECQFCLEKTRKTVVPPDSKACSECGNRLPLDSTFCSRCRHQFHDFGGAPSAAYSTSCLNCGSDLPADSEFCGDCGRPVISTHAPTAALAPPPPPPAPPTRSTPARVFDTTPAIAEEIKPPPSLLSEPIVKGTIGVLGGIVVLAAIIGVVSKSGSTSSSSSAINNANYMRSTNAMISNRAYNTAVNAAANAAKVTNVNRATSSSGDYRIGLTGRLTRDMMVRESPGVASSTGGAHYRGARVKILDVQEFNDDGMTFDWYQIEVLSTGTSMAPENEGLNKDYGALDIGWIHSNPRIKGSRREIAVRFED